MRIGLCLVDASWGNSTDTVYEFCQRSVHSAILQPSHGKGVGASNQPFADYRKQSGDRVGHNWRIPSTTGKRAVRYVLYDTNYWKSFVFARLAVAIGDKSCLSLFGTRPEHHQLLAEHLTAEYPVTTTGRGRIVEEWKQRPNHPDNHWFDCLVGNAVAASMLGIQLATGTTKKPKERMTLAQMAAMSGRPSARDLAAMSRGR